MRVGIIIPALNAARHLPELIESIRAVDAGWPIILVNDGSRDETETVARGLDLIVLKHDTNRGKGAALKTGFARALSMNLDAVIQMDADLQHQASALPDFLGAFGSGRYDLIVGRRDFHDGRMPWPRRMSNTMTSWAVSRACGTHVPDSQSGYRMIARRVLELVHATADAFDFESEFLVRAAQAGFRVGSVPIPTVYGNERSAIRPWRDTWQFIKLMGLFWRKRPRNQVHGAQEPA